MSAFKKLNQQDAFVTSYIARKSWSITGLQLVDYGVQVLSADSGSSPSYELSTPELNYRSLEQLYYSNYDKVTGVMLESSSYYNYIESSFTTSSRILNDSAVIFSLPKEVFGTNIEPGTLKIGSDDDYIINQDDYILIDYLQQSEQLFDDKEGNLRTGSPSGSIVGNVIYSHGQVIITDPTLVNTYKSYPSQSLDWKSNLPIYTYNYNVKISDYEFNFTQNPTATSGSSVLEYSGSSYNQPSGILADNVTGSYFQPYITAVGLYNDSNELIAVAKLAQPLPKSANTEMTIQVKLDI